VIYVQNSSMAGL